ncbi:hypothetical protein EHS25_004826 [Saitozyma podzolica]|uniref:Uncharacterized protein n=1 Tax=Saitozyma podzolica TaxID=1890683 RepID=A0A427Y2V8_9TREE|nr:hypothetical protein EHS25_004826 [Saitozyma podzolica]
MGEEGRNVADRLGGGVRGEVGSSEVWREDDSPEDLEANEREGMGMGMVMGIGQMGFQQGFRPGMMQPGFRPGFF